MFVQGTNVEGVLRAFLRSTITKSEITDHIERYRKYTLAN